MIFEDPSDANSFIFIFQMKMVELAIYLPEAFRPARILLAYN